MHVLAQAFSLPKAGNSSAEYEDAYWPEKQIDRSAEAFSFAVADGATEASFSGLWARMLVRAFCRGQFNGSRLETSLRGLQKKWLDEVSQKPLPWYAEEKIRSGAFSSLIGLTLSNHKLNVSQRGRWQALAIGDSCFFQVRQARVISLFPYEQSEQFDNHPLLLSSNPTSNGEIKTHILREKGEWEEGDEFYLMTDALACWFMKTIEENELPFEVLRDITDSNQFSDFITQLRQTKCIRNDDVTFLRIDIP